MSKASKKKTPKTSGAPYGLDRTNKRRSGVACLDLVEKVQHGEVDPDQAKYIARLELFREIPRDFFLSLADLAKIPNTPGRRRWFQHQVHNVIHDVWDQQERLDTLDAAGKNDAYADAIDKLKSATLALARLKNTVDTEELWFSINTIQREINRFLEFSGADVPKPRPRNRGRPKGEVKDKALRRLVLELLDVAWFTGGNLSLEKNIGRGSLIEAIDQLERFLPDGAVPRPLPLATLQRIKTDFQKSTKKRTRPA